MKDKKYTLKDLKKAWDASDDYREQVERIASFRSNFDKPTYPNKKEYFERFK